MIKDELEQLGDILRRVAPGLVDSGLRIVKYHPEEAPRVRYHFLEALKKGGYDLLNLPVLPAPERMPSSGVPFANILDGEKVIGHLRLPIEAFSTTTLFAGAAGTGKTTAVFEVISHLIERGVNVRAWDWQGQYEILCDKFPEDSIALRPNELKINPAMSPGNMPVDEWINIFTSLWRSLYAGEGVLELLRRGIKSIHKNYSNPTMYHLKHWVENQKFKPTERYYGYHESLRRCLNMLLDSFGETFACAEGFPKSFADKKLTVYRMHGQDPVLGNFLQDLDAERLRAVHSPFSDGLQTLLVYEEAHLRFSSSIRQRETEVGERLALTHARTLRKYGIGILLVDQTVSLFPAQILANLGTLLSFRIVNANCLRKIGDVMGLSYEQRVALSQLPNRRAVVFSHLC